MSVHMAAAESSFSSQLPMYLIMAGLLGIMVWTMMRQRKNQRAAQDMRETLAVGSKVMTGSGYFGVITRIDGDRVFLRGPSGEETEWLKLAINKLDEPVTPAITETPADPMDTSRDDK